MLKLFYPSYRWTLWGSSLVVFVLACLLWRVGWSDWINGPVMEAESTGDSFARTFGSFGQIPYSTSVERAGGVTGGSLVAMLVASLLVFLLFRWPNNRLRWVAVIKGLLLSLIVFALLYLLWLGATQMMLGWTMRASISVDNVLVRMGAWTAYPDIKKMSEVGPTVLGHMLIYLATLTLTLFIFWVIARFWVAMTADRDR